MDTGLVNAKYIFLDIVKYSYNRPAEAQADIIGTLNETAKSVLSGYTLSDGSIKLLPTGDGICICFLNTESSRYDIHILMALSILEKLQTYNEGIKDPLRKFSIRVGLNENVDNLIIDINGNENLSGSGITLSQRIMNVADEGNILLSAQVHEVLSKREKYFNKFRKLPNVSVKHDSITIYQYVSENLNYLNNNIPSSLVPKPKPEPKISQITAAYLALLHRDINRIVFMLTKEGGDHDYYCLRTAYWFFAHDYLGRLKETITSKYHPISPGKSDEETIDIIENTNFRIQSEFADLAYDSPSFHPWIFKFTEPIKYLFVNESGLDKIKKDWPKLVETILNDKEA